MHPDRTRTSGRSLDLPPPLGITVGPDGARVAVFAGHADAVELCVFAPDGTERRTELGRRRHGVHWDQVPGLPVGSVYGFRAHGPWRPAHGLRHNPAKLLLDPYARGVQGTLTWRPEVFGHVVGADLTGDPDVPDHRDSAPHVPRGVVLDGAFDWGGDRAPAVPWSRTVLYEAHVRGQTRRLADVPQRLRGTYAGLAHPASVEHLTRLGVTTVQLLPVHTFVSEPALALRGMTNHWGYNTLGFFAPHAGYATADDPAGVLAEFQGMVRTLHAAGLEVLLDVVYNHTCEQGRTGATLSWRGLDNRSYYRLEADGRDADVTGCGNTLDFRNARVVQLAVDSLRYWVRECHVDGFRFDLATALARGRDDQYDPDHPFLVALRTDPVLSQVKLIAEPWDVGPHGWRTGQFPPPLAEWNDRYRDTVRSFWLADAARGPAGQAGHGVRELATRLSGSQDLFGANDRGPLASVNYVAAHDGFTLADTTAYERKHNEANGEGNRDGHDDNRCWNHGVEGPTSDPDVNVGRRRSARNLLGTLLLSTGVPMLAAGDELGRTQRGNNNAYCRDDETSSVDWELADWQRGLLGTTRRLLRLRAELPVLRQTDFFGGRPPAPDGAGDLGWFAADGTPMDDARWHDPHQRVLQAFFHGGTVGGRSALLVLCGAAVPTEVVLPGEPWAAGYGLLWDSADEHPGDDPPDAVPPGPVTLTPHSLHLYTPLAPPAPDCSTRTAAGGPGTGSGGAT